MRVLVLALGTRGDFELFRGLGGALRARGHTVAVGSSPFNAEAVADAGLDFVPIGDGGRDELVGVVRALAAEPDLARRTRVFADRWVRPQLAAGSRALTAAGVKSDYFVSNLKLALQRGTSVVPGAFVTYDPPAEVADLPRYGSARHGGRVIELVAMNKALADPDDRWGAPFRFTGFWRPLLRRATQAEDLDRFLAAGPAPVVLTMGSMATFDAARLLGAFGAALDRSGRRGVVVGGWGGLGTAAGANRRLCCVDEADYERLFARAACVVHHGGAGTVSAALHAGRPSILLPQLLAQERFAAMLVRERLATGAFDADTVDGATLAAAIGRALDDPSVADSALRWQHRVAADDGVAGAVAAIESHAARHPPVIERPA